MGGGYVRELRRALGDEGGVEEEEGDEGVECREGSRLVGEVF